MVSFASRNKLRGWFIALAEVCYAFGIANFWITWFLAPNTEDSLPVGYYDHEAPFVFTDSIVIVMLLWGAVYQVLEEPIGGTIGLVVAGMLIFHGVLDVAYYSRTGMFAAEHGGLSNALIPTLFLGLATLLIIHFANCSSPEDSLTDSDYSDVMGWFATRSTLTTKCVAFAEVCFAIGIALFWVTWFNTPHTEDWLPAGYYNHEAPFVFTDSIVIALLMSGAVYQVLEEPIGGTIGLVAAGMLIFLGLLDAAYYARTGMFAPEHDGVSNALIPTLVLGLATTLILRFAGCRSSKHLPTDSESSDEEDNAV